ncbi:MAG TPA: hypothetical protein VFB54_15545 [Burkholderiales bacterium]|nr:hypothetical protein [Burkholderiales bacterium]
MIASSHTAARTSTRSSAKPRTLATLGAVALSALLATYGAIGNADEPKVKVTDDSFKCILEMTKVRHFYVDNLLGNLEQTVAVATKGEGDYPEGSVLQLMPNEVMVKQQKGFSPATRDWEFFWIDVDKNGSKIFTRGFAEVNNRFGLNCFACHVKAEAKYDFVCEQGHGCDAIPVTREMFGALQRTDPRCGERPVSAEDQAALQELGQIVKALTEKK